MVENFLKKESCWLFPRKCEKVQVFQRVANQFEFGKEYTEKKSISDLEKSMKIMHF